MNPNNVFINENNMIKILDFNVSKIAANDQINIDNKFKYSLFTKTGTPIYTAPEMHSSFRYT